MSSRWFRLNEKEVQDSDDANITRKEPDFHGYEDDIDGYSGNTSHPEGAPQWVVRVYADDATLDALAAESGVVALDSVPTQALNNMFGQNRSASEWNDAFKIE